MDITAIGSASSYSQQLQMQTQWKLKQQSGDMSGHQQSLKDYLTANSNATETEESGTASDAGQIASIKAKISAGQKLSAKEKEILKSEDPATYDKIRSVEKWQRDYESALRRCKTQEDVEQLDRSRLAISLKSASEGGDGTLAYRNALLSESHASFVQSNEFHALPKGDQAEAARNAKSSSFLRKLEQADQEEAAAGGVQAAAGGAHTAETRGSGKTRTGIFLTGTDTYQKVDARDKEKLEIYTPEDVEHNGQAAAARQSEEEDA